MANQYTAFRFVSDTHKECSACKAIKPHTEYHKDSNAKRSLGLAYYCKSCANSKGRDHHRSKQANNPEYKRKARDAFIKRQHGITLQQYEVKLAEQDSLCAICSVKLLPYGHSTHLDHCHKSGKLRQFLCTNCNRGLGHFQDSPELLKIAAEYLNSHSGYGNPKEGIHDE